MLKDNIQTGLNRQIELESESSQYYLSMASWAETLGMNGVAAFLYRQSDEERMHMVKLFRYINERGGHAVAPAIREPRKTFDSVVQLFELVLEHEVMVSAEINHLVESCLSEKDYTTHNFLQWYVAEQIEEEALARNVLDKLNLIGGDKGSLYIFDRDLETLQIKPSIGPQ